MNTFAQMIAVLCGKRIHYMYKVVGTWLLVLCMMLSCVACSHADVPASSEPSAVQTTVSSEAEASAGQATTDISRITNSSVSQAPVSSTRQAEDAVTSIEYDSSVKTVAQSTEAPGYTLPAETTNRPSSGYTTAFAPNWNTVRSTAATTTKATLDRTSNTTTATKTAQPTAKACLNGVAISQYVIVRSAKALDYTVRACEYIQERVLNRTGVRLAIVEDNLPATTANEIVVGETERAISARLNTYTENLQFTLWANQGQIAMEADGFAIAAAAKYFVETYIRGGEFESNVPTVPKICEPLTEKPNNFIFLIGDGMGQNHTRLFEVMSASLETDYSDGEETFYGFMLPYKGVVRTNSLSGVTDSAAAATALATGWKTINGYVGKDENLKDVRSLTEVAGSLGMFTAIMSTEGNTGATPAGFSAHANNRDDATDIMTSQMALKGKCGTLYKCGFNLYEKSGIQTIEDYVVDMLQRASKSEMGSFIMYEEAYIDKYSHSMDVGGAFKAMVRFNQVIATFMEWALYNPDTLVIITADHETGGLTQKSGAYAFTQSSHTGSDVSLFAFGQGGKLFNDREIENVQIPKTLAHMWGVDNFGNPNDGAPAFR